VTVLAGPSSNGAGGLAAARLLGIAGAEVQVVLVGPARLTSQLRALTDGGVAVSSIEGADWGSVEHPGEVVIDAMLGIGGEPPLRHAPEAAATWLRRYDVLVVAVDLPSGVGPELGLRGACITADVTVALGRPTTALFAPIVQPYVGDLYLADVGLPEAAWSAAGVPSAPRSLFAAGPLVRLTADRRASDAGTPDQAAGQERSDA
jgi:hydroxyethylthiazole kinase-like uncharacterized protein yjeF